MSQKVHAKATAKVMAIVRPWMGWLIAAALLAVVVAAFDQMVPLQVRVLVNAAFDRKQGVTWQMIAVLGGLLGISQLLKIAQRLATEWAATRISARLFEHGVHHLLSYPVTHFHHNHSGALQVRLERSTRAIVDLLKTGLADMLTPLVGLTIAIGLMLRADLVVGLTAAAIIPLLVGLTIWQAKSQNGIRVAVNMAREAQGVRVAEAVLGIEQVKLFHAELAEARIAGEISESLADKEYKHHCAMAAFDLAKFWIERLGFAAVLILGLKQALRPGGNAGPGDVLMLLMLFDRVAEPVRHLHRLIDESTERWILAQNYLQIVRTDPVAPQQKSSEGELSEKIGRPCDVVFDQVTFAYAPDAEPILNEVSLSVSGGTKIAVVGKSGCGKSTLGRLLAGLYTPNSGRILVDNEEIQPIERPSTARTVGMLSQEVHIFAGTILENIRYGQPEAGIEDVRRVAEIAGLADFIESLEDSYETQLGQHGYGISGGQKQRLALARLILQNPDVIVFDEPSSALDPENARRFFQIVLQLFQNKTIFVITHDTSNLDWADHVLVLKDGHIWWEDFQEDRLTTSFLSESVGSRKRQLQLPN